MKKGVLCLALALVLTLVPTIAAPAQAVDEVSYSAAFDAIRSRPSDDPMFFGYYSGSRYSVTDITYAFYDIDGNGVEELIFTNPDAAAVIYTLSGGEEIKLLELGGGRAEGFTGVNERGYISSHGADGAASGADTFFKITEDGKSVSRVVFIYEGIYDGSDYPNMKYEIVTSEGRRSVTESEFWEQWDAFWAESISLKWNTLTEETGKTVSPTASTVYVNGEKIGFEAYNIGGYNYFKLRDLAIVLNGTEKQFEVGYNDNTKAITLTSGKSYTSVGGELTEGDGKPKTASVTESRVYLDEKELALVAYNINGNNFFKLREIMSAIDVYVGYDSATGEITLDTRNSYVPEE